MARFTKSMQEDNLRTKRTFAIIIGVFLAVSSLYAIAINERPQVDTVNEIENVAPLKLEDVKIPSVPVLLF